MGGVCSGTTQWFTRIKIDCTFLFLDGKFPIDTASVIKEHHFLDQDSIQSLYRLVTSFKKELYDVHGFSKEYMTISCSLVSVY